MEYLPLSQERFRVSTYPVASSLLYVIAGLLLVAAFLKSVSFAGDVVSQHVYFWDPVIFGGVVVGEIVLAAWLLLLGVTRLTKWATIGFFTILAAFNVFAIAQNQESCGCFGAIKVSPVWMLVIDFLAIVLCWLFWRSPSGSVASKRIFGLKYRYICIPVLLGIAGCFFVARMLVAPTPTGIVIDDRSLVVSIPAEKDVSRKILMTNYGAAAVKIYGGIGSCGLSVRQELPVVIKSGETIALPIVFRGIDRTKKSAITRMLILWTSDPQAPEIVKTVYARIDPK